jgi:hypothetical protein
LLLNRNRLDRRTVWNKIGKNRVGAAAVRAMEVDGALTQIKRSQIKPSFGLADIAFNFGALGLRARGGGLA